MNKKHSANNGDIEYFISVLKTNGNIDSIAQSLKVLWQDPIADESIVPYIKALLFLKKACLVMTPYMFGEIAYLAGKALASTYEALGNKQPVTWTVATPLDTEELSNLAKTHNLQIGGGVEGMIAAYDELNGKGEIHLLKAYHFTAHSDVYLSKVGLNWDTPENRRKRTEYRKSVVQQILPETKNIECDDSFWDQKYAELAEDGQYKEVFGAIANPIWMK